MPKRRRARHHRRRPWFHSILAGVQDWWRQVQLAVGQAPQPKRKPGWTCRNCGYGTTKFCEECGLGYRCCCPHNPNNLDPYEVNP